MNEDKILYEIEKTIASLDSAVLPQDCGLKLHDIDSLCEHSSSRKKHDYVQPGKILLIITILLNIITLYTVFSLTSSADRHKQLVSGLKNDLKIEQSQSLF
jgi:hypothetical protein